MCAVQAGFLGKEVIILEKNVEPGAKILISGGGRCNYTNLFSSSQNFISENPHFCKSAFSQWSVEDTINFFETYGIYGKEKTLGQLFPVTDKAKDVVKVFTSLCNELGQEIRCNAEVVSVTREDEGVTVYPQARVIRLIQDKGLQKEFFKHNDIPSAPFQLINSPDGLKKTTMPFPYIQKLRRDGYDGRGVCKIISSEDYSKAFAESIKWNPSRPVNLRILPEPRLRVSGLLMPPYREDELPHRRPQ